MNALIFRFSRQIAACLVFLVAAQMSEGAALPVQEPQQQQPAQPQQPQPDAGQQAQPARAQPDGQDVPQAPEPAGQQARGEGSTGFASSSQDAQPQVNQKPEGTAAGPYSRPTGVAGSRPAGAAIGPAKQRRVKAIVIRMSLIIAGAAAAGAVIGLSKGSSSRPPQ